MNAPHSGSVLPHRLFARSSDHLDPDPIALADLLAPRPAASVIYRVRDRGMEEEGIRPGDILILERAQPLREGQIALVAVDGGSRLVRVEGHAGRLRFAGMPPDDATVEHLATVSRILRILLP